LQRYLSIWFTNIVGELKTSARDQLVAVGADLLLYLRLRAARK